MMMQAHALAEGLGGRRSGSGSMPAQSELSVQPATVATSHRANAGNNSSDDGPETSWEEAFISLGDAVDEVVRALPRKMGPGDD